MLPVFLVLVVLLHQIDLDVIVIVSLVLVIAPLILDFPPVASRSRKRRRQGVSDKLLQTLDD